MAVNQAIIGDGRVSYRIGLPADSPAGQFKDLEMRSDWANGWRWEREAHEGREPPCQCDGCRRRRLGP